MTDVRKWVERQAAKIVEGCGTNSDIQLIADTYTPTITKLICIEKRLAVAVALRDAAKHRLVRYPTDPLSRCSCGWKPTSCDIAAEWERHILTLIPSADAQTLAAHDVEVWNEAIEEVEKSLSIYSCSCSRRVSALKREK